MATQPDMSAVGADIRAQIAKRAPLANPSFTGTPKAPTAKTGTKTTQLATTAFVYAAISALYTQVTQRTAGRFPLNGGFYGY